MRVTALTLLLAAASCAVAKHGEGETRGDADDDDVQSSSTAPSPSPTSSSSSTPPSPSPTATSPFQFLPPSNATTCSNTTLQWESSNISVPLTLTITNERATASGTPSGAGTMLVSRTLATNITATAGRFTWQRVDVPPGSYVAVAFDTARTAGIFVQSPPFFVQMGSDESCLLPSTSNPGSSSGSGTPTSASDPASSSESSSSSEGEGADADLKSLSPGVLRGVVAGVVIGVLLLILAATFPHYWKDALVRRRRSRHPGGPYETF